MRLGRGFRWPIGEGSGILGGMTTGRREFMLGVCAGAVALRCGAADAPPLRAAVIGHTGRGDFGHGMDVIFSGREGIEVVAVADPSDAGRAQAIKRCGARAGYADYRQMLEKERPQLASIAPRMTGERRE